MTEAALALGRAIVMFISQALHDAWSPAAALAFGSFCLLIEPSRSMPLKRLGVAIGSAVSIYLIVILLQEVL